MNEEILRRTLDEVRLLTPLIDLTLDQEKAITEWLAPTITLIVKEEKEHLLDDIRKETDTKSSYELLGNRTVDEYCAHIKEICNPPTP